MRVQNRENLSERLLEIIYILFLIIVIATTIDAGTGV